MHIFDDTVGYSHCVTWQILSSFAVDVLFGLRLRSWFCFAVFLSMAKRKSGRGICVSFFGVGIFVVFLLICHINETTVFHAEISN